MTYPPEECTPPRSGHSTHLGHSLHRVDARTCHGRLHLMISGSRSTVVARAATPRLGDDALDGMRRICHGKSITDLWTILARNPRVVRAVDNLQLTEPWLHTSIRSRPAHPLSRARGDADDRERAYSRARVPRHEGCDGARHSLQRRSHTQGAARPSPHSIVASVVRAHLPWCCTGLALAARRPCWSCDRAADSSSRPRKDGDGARRPGGGQDASHACVLAAPTTSAPRCDSAQ